MCEYRDRKRLSSFTAKLSRMVGDVKRKRKVLAAQRTFVLDLFTAPPSSSAFTPLFPFFPSHIPPSSLSKTSHFTSHTPSTSPLSPSPVRPTAYSTPHSAISSPVRTHNSLRSAPASQQHIPHIDPHPAKKTLHTHPSPPLHSSTSLVLASMGPCHCSGKYLVQRASWAVILLAFLCTFFCTGKETAFAVATVGHLILEIAMGLGLLAREPNLSHAEQASFHHHLAGLDNSGHKDGTVGSNMGQIGPLNRSAMVLWRRKLLQLTVGASRQWNRRIKSWTQLNESVESNMRQRETGGSKGSTASGRTSVAADQRANWSAELKLQVMLLFTLWGLFYGRFSAMFMAMCCIFMCPKMERLFSFNRR